MCEHAHLYMYIHIYIRVYIEMQIQCYTIVDQDTRSIFHLNDFPFEMVTNL